MVRFRPLTGVGRDTKKSVPRKDRNFIGGKGRHARIRESRYRELLLDLLGRELRLPRWISGRFEEKGEKPCPPQIAR